MEKILDNIESVRVGDNGKSAFYLLLGFCIGILVGAAIAPKFFGCFNGSWNGNNAPTQIK